ncbi:hypothetical protein Tco_1003693 [Tanacetum coccineum]|uniref:Uncharacterized protein n=1 Tax=Tanacetum coccineum TaxID=301880 RepID=A0ABQ5FA18_9ASTR
MDGRTSPLFSMGTHRTIIKSSNGDTPFSLTNEMNQPHPSRNRMPTLEGQRVDLVQNDEALPAVQEALKTRRLGITATTCNRAEDTEKLGPTMEGPYKVTEALGKGAYKLRGRDGKQLIADLEYQQP